MSLLGKRERSCCARSWEIEAARDGRISGAALEAMARHVEECSECLALVDYLEGLGHSLRAIAPRVDERILPRLRLAILDRVDAEMTGRPIPQQGRRRRLLLPLVAAAAIATLVAAAKWQRAPAPALLASTTTSTTTIDTIDEGGARWSKTTGDDVELVDLSDGTLRLHVKRDPGGKRVIVRVPDGEIEDLGTIFHVVVVHGRTLRVGVDEGRVIMRLAHMTPITIPSGSSWERPVEPVATAIAPSVSPPVAPAKRAPAENRSVARPAAPPDAAQEDAAYLHTIRLLRERREDEARAAAREYLRLFPDGFRRDEMARVAQ